MTIWHFRLFLSVAETGSMSAAAALHDVRQPTVSQKISELEHYYHVLLFERLGNRLHITETGRRLLPLAKDAISKFDSLEEFLCEERGASRLRIGATVTIGCSIFAQILESYRLQQPETEVFALIDNTATICSKLLANELDIGLVEGTVSSQELISIPQINDYLVLACGRNHSFYHKPKLYSHELDGMGFVIREHGSGTRALFEKYLQEHNLHIHPILEYNNPDAMRSAIRVNNCLAVISARLLEQEAREGEVRLFQSQEKEWNRTFNLVFHKNKHISRAMRCFQQLLSQFHDIEPAVQNVMRPLMSG